MRTKSGREIKRPVESYYQDCVMKATVMENARSKGRQKKQNREHHEKYQLKIKQQKAKQQKDKQDKSKKRGGLKVKVNIKKK